MERWDPEDPSDETKGKRYCQECDAHLLELTRRQIANGNGYVHGCPHCRSYRDLRVNPPAKREMATDGGDGQ